MEAKALVASQTCTQEDTRASLHNALLAFWPDIASIDLSCATKTACNGAKIILACLSLS